MDTRSIAFAVPFFFALIGVEIWLSERRRRRAKARGEAPIERTYRFADTIRPLPNGDLFLDLTQFDVLVPDERASVAA